MALPSALTLQTVCGKTNQGFTQFENWIAGRTCDDVTRWIEDHRLAIVKTCEDALLFGRPASLRLQQVLCIELEWINRITTDRSVGDATVKLIDVTLLDVETVVSRFHSVPVREIDADKRVETSLTRPTSLGNDGTVLITCSCATPAAATSADLASWPAELFMLGRLNGYVFAQTAGTVNARAPMSAAFGVTPPNARAAGCGSRIAAQVAAPASDDWQAQAHARLSAVSDYSPISEVERARLPELITSLILPPAGIYRTSDPGELADFHNQQCSRLVEWVKAEPLRRGSETVLEGEALEARLKALVDAKEAAAKSSSIAAAGAATAATRAWTA